MKGPSADQEMESTESIVSGTDQLRGEIRSLNTCMTVRARLLNRLLVEEYNQTVQQNRQREVISGLRSLIDRLDPNALPASAIRPEPGHLPVDHVAVHRGHYEKLLADQKRLDEILRDRVYQFRRRLLQLEARVRRLL